MLEQTETKDSLQEQVREIIEEKLRKNRFPIPQVGIMTELLPIKTVGVQGDGGTYRHPVMIGIFTKERHLFVPINPEILMEISTGITNSISDINRVCFLLKDLPLDINLNPQ